jgi:hypothetical protein
MLHGKTHGESCSWSARRTHLGWRGTTSLSRCSFEGSILGSASFKSLPEASQRWELDPINALFLPLRPLE